MQNLRRKFGVEIVVVCLLTVIVGGFMGGLALTGRLGGGDDEEVAAVLGRSYTGKRLVVVEQESCGWCVRFRKDLGPWYQHSSYQEAAPLTYLHIREAGGGFYDFNAPVRSTPTLVVVNSKGQETARLVGYPGSRDRFMKFLDRHL